MLTFEEFIEDFPTNRCCQGSKTAERIYDLITSEKSRIKMASYADIGITPLSAVVDEVISIAKKQNSDFSLTRKVERQSVGRMTKEALVDLGYEPLSRARVLSSRSDNPFSTAVTYKLTDNGSEFVFKEIRKKEN